MKAYFYGLMAILTVWITSFFLNQINNAFDWKVLPILFTGSAFMVKATRAIVG
jgi:hypothetical protein